MMTRSNCWPPPRPARLSATITRKGIKGAQAVALAVYRARMGASKEAIREETAVRFQYDLSRTLDEIRPGYSFDVSCQGSVPEAILAFLESDDYETAVRLAISLGGDSDTMACIAGAIAEAFYGGVPPAIAHETRQRLPADLLTIVDQFYEQIYVTKDRGRRTEKAVRLPSSSSVTKRQILC
jgi:ADP-ribosylglycohydrolase